MKLVVKTTGQFQVYSVAPEQFVKAGRPTVVRPSAFIQSNIGAGRLVVLGQVTDAATDLELQAMIKENGADLAVASFLSMHAIDPDAPQPEPEPQPAAKKRPGRPRKAS